MNDEKRGGLNILALSFQFCCYWDSFPQDIRLHNNTKELLIR